MMSFTSPDFFFLIFMISLHGEKLKNGPYITIHVFRAVLAAPAAVDRGGLGRRGGAHPVLRGPLDTGGNTCGLLGWY